MKTVHAFKHWSTDAPGGVGQRDGERADDGVAVRFHSEERPKVSLSSL